MNERQFSRFVDLCLLIPLLHCDWWRSCVCDVLHCWRYDRDDDYCRTSQSEVIYVMIIVLRDLSENTSDSSSSISFRLIQSESDIKFFLRSDHLACKLIENLWLIYRLSSLIIKRYFTVSITTFMCLPERKIWLMIRKLSVNIWKCVIFTGRSLQCLWSVLIFISIESNKSTQYFRNTLSHWVFSWIVSLRIKDYFMCFIPEVKTKIVRTWWIVNLFFIFQTSSFQKWQKNSFEVRCRRSILLWRESLIVELLFSCHLLLIMSVSSFIVSIPTIFPFCQFLEQYHAHSELCPYNFQLKLKCFARDFLHEVTSLGFFTVLSQQWFCWIMSRFSKLFLQ